MPFIHTHPTNLPTYLHDIEGMFRRPERLGVEAAGLGREAEGRLRQRVQGELLRGPASGPVQTARPRLDRRRPSRGEQDNKREKFMPISARQG
eukprot:scaffold102177_cov35-Prasinocladus_malaysianus.AAC.1